MSAPFYRWAATCMETAQPAPATLSAAQPSAACWGDAYVTALSVPELDRSRHDTVELEATVHPGASCSPPNPQSPAADTPAPEWRRSQFNFHIAGIRHFGSDLLSIAALQFQRPLATNVLDSRHRNTARAGHPVLPTLRLRLQDTRQQRVRQALEHASPCNATLDLLSGSNTPWLRFIFRNLRLQPSAAASEPAASLDLTFTSVSIYLPR